MGPDDRGGRRVADDKETGANPCHLDLDCMDDLGYDRAHPRRWHRPGVHLRTLHHEGQNVRLNLP